MEELKKIHIESPDRSRYALPHTTTLYQVYESGWWITEIFGSNAVLVRPRLRHKDGFGSCERMLDTSQITPKAMKFIEKTARDKWKIYKQRMLTYKYGRPTIKSKTEMENK